MSTIELEPPTLSRRGAALPGASLPGAVMPGAIPPGTALTRRERVVLSNLSEDVTLEQIARKLFVTRNTVKSQVRSVYRKLGVSTRAEAVAWRRRSGQPTDLF